MIWALGLGALVEFAWLLWIYCADKGWPLRTAVSSMAIGAFGFYGTRAGLTGHPLALILGYGAGSYVAAYLKGRRC